MSFGEKLKDEIIEWNNTFPVDRWWRQKYNVPYNSSKHRECDFFDQLFEYMEEKAFDKFYESQQYEQGDWLKEQERSPEEKIQSLQDQAKNALDNFDDEEFE